MNKEDIKAQSPLLVDEAAGNDPARHTPGLSPISERVYEESQYADINNTYDSVANTTVNMDITLAAESLREAMQRVYQHYIDDDDSAQQSASNMKIVLQSLDQPGPYMEIVRALLGEDVPREQEIAHANLIRRDPTGFIAEQYYKLVLNNKIPVSDALNDMSALNAMDRTMIALILRRWIFTRNFLKWKEALGVPVKQDVLKARWAADDCTYETAAETSALCRILKTNKRGVAIGGNRNHKSQKRY